MEQVLRENAAARAAVDRKQAELRRCAAATAETLEATEKAERASRKELEAKRQARPIAQPELAAEAMVTVAFNLGASALDRSSAERDEIVERIVGEVRMIMRGAEAMGAGWEP